MRENKKVVTSNLGSLAGYYTVKDLGIVSASVAPSKFLLKDIMAMIRQVFGKEMKEYTDMINEARNTALERMTKEAEKLGADAVLNIRFMGTGVSVGSAEMMAYGTAVKVEPNKEFKEP